MRVISAFVSIRFKMLNVILILCVVISVKGNDSSQFVDLSYPLNNDTLTWIAKDKFATVGQVVVDEPNFFYTRSNFIGPEHGGTHLDAPYHFNKNGWTLDKIPLERFFSPGVLIDISDKVNDNPSFELQPQHLDEWEQKNGRIPSGVIVLLKFGWYKRYGDRMAYFGNITMPYSFPGISGAAAKWFVDHGGIYGVGLDTPSLDSGKSQKAPAHRTLLGALIFGIENLSFKDVQLPVKGFMVIALPMKITNGTGAPCRVVAILGVD